MSFTSSVERSVMHAWDVTPEQAMRLQERLSELVIRQDQLDQPCCVAGVDVGYTSGSDAAHTAILVLSYPGLQLQEQVVIARQIRFPYIPGLLSFREAPAILEALSALSHPPDLLLCDGHGIAHPRRLGIASHVGLLADIPAIGVAKSLLTGKHMPVPDAKGAWQALIERGETVGAALRTRSGAKPVYVSTGHRVSLDTAIGIVLGCCAGHRLPEPLHQAHRLASQKPGGSL